MGLGSWVFLYWLAAPLSLVSALVALALSFTGRQLRTALVMAGLSCLLNLSLIALFARAHSDLALRVEKPSDLFPKDDLLRTARQNGAISLLGLGLALGTVWRSRRALHGAALGER